LPPFINFAPLDNVITELSKAAEAYKKSLRRSRRARRPVNSLRFGARAESSADGKRAPPDESRRPPGRPWFKHEIYAPGQYTGYEAKPFPASAKPWNSSAGKKPKKQVGIAAKTLQQEVVLINEAAAKLSALH